MSLAGFAARLRWVMEHWDRIGFSVTDLYTWSSAIRLIVIHSSAFQTLLNIICFLTLLSNIYPLCKLIKYTYTLMINKCTVRVCMYVCVGVYVYMCVEHMVCFNDLS